MDNKKGYAQFESKSIRTLLRHPFVAVVMHWTFQSLFYMDRTERWFKLMLDGLGTLLLSTALIIRWPWYIACSVALLVSHTLNFLLNGQLWGVLKHYGWVGLTSESFEDYVRNFSIRARCEPSISFVVYCGSLSRMEWMPSSDLDARIVRHAGFTNGLRACWFLLRERSRALIKRFPLDVYVLDSEASLQKLGKEDRSIIH